MTGRPSTGTSGHVEAAIRRRFLDDRRTDVPAAAILAELVAEHLPLAGEDEVTATFERLHASLVGLGPLDPLLRDPQVTDVLVNGAGPVWVERQGRLVRTDVTVTDDAIDLIVERAFRRTGTSVDRSHPIGDTRLADGARVSVVLPPVAPDGPHVAIRRFRPTPVPIGEFGPPEVGRRLVDAVRRNANIVVFGGTGSGKTTLVGTLAGSIDPAHRIVTIEDAAELRIDRPHVVRLEARPDNGDGAGGVDLRTLVRAALRLRPDHIIVGEVRGGEALDMLWAMATGHDGSLSTCHARSAADALARLETFVLLAGTELPAAAVRSQVLAAVDVVVGVQRSGGRRQVVSIHEVDEASGIDGALRPVYVDGRWW